ncbi:MAG: prepilin peptidase [Deltaproteobacteria bacterium]|nr:prepilin peptidase [Deltaproteobacteria bacterium]
MATQSAQMMSPVTPAAETSETASRLLANRERAGSLTSSLLVAAGIGAALVMAHSHATQPVPAFWLAAVFLVVIAQQDAWRRRIPNWSIGVGLLAALAWHGWQGGIVGAGLALAGIAVPFVLLLAPFAVRAVGAGDVKAFMVLGGLWGVSTVLSVIVWSVAVAGVMAVAYVAARGELRAFIRRWGTMLTAPLYGGGLRYVAPTPEEAAAGGLPLGIAIGVAAAAHLLFGGPWQ